MCTPYVHTHTHTSMHVRGAPTLARSFCKRVCAHVCSLSLSRSAWSLITFLTRSARHTADDCHVHVMSKCTMPIGSQPTLTFTLTPVTPLRLFTHCCTIGTRELCILLLFYCCFIFSALCVRLAKWFAEIRFWNGVQRLWNDVNMQAGTETHAENEHKREWESVRGRERERERYTGAPLFDYDFTTDAGAHKPWFMPRCET